MASTALQQIRALTLKQITLLSRQRKTLACQILFPLIFILFYWGSMMVVNMAMSYVPSGPSTTGYNRYNVMDKIMNFYKVEADKEQRNITVPYRFLVSGSSFGYLNGDGSKSGLFANIPQVTVNVHTQSLSQPRFGSRIPITTHNLTSAYAIDDYLYERTLHVVPNAAARASYDVISAIIIDDEKPSVQGKPIHYTIQYPRTCSSLSGLLVVDDAMGFDFQATGSACAKLIRSSAVSSVNTAFARQLTGNSNFTIKAYMQQMPVTNPGISLASLASSGGSLLGTILLFPLPLFVYPLVLEKSNKLREMMKLSGMKMKYYWLVTLGINFLLYMIQCMFTLVLGYILGLPMLNGANPLMMITLFVASAICILAMSIFISSIMGSTLAASVIGYLAAIVLPQFNTVIEMYLKKTLSSFAYVLLMILNPPLAIQHTIQSGILDVCGTGICPGFKEMFTFSDFNLGILVILLDSLIMILLGFYLDAVLPQSWGLRKSPWFCIEPLLCCFKSKGSNSARMRQQADTHEQADDTMQLISNTTGSDHHHHHINDHADVVSSTTTTTAAAAAASSSILIEEDEDVSMERERVAQMNTSDSSIVIKSLSKKFGSLVAVNNISLSMNMGECFGLLGANGAGKTTLMNCLVGLFPPTSGTAYLNGLDIRNDMDKIRTESLGYCPQHEIQWPELTVTEHLLFFARLKGISRSQERAHVNEILEKIGLQGLKGNDKSSALSGGMKRRLSIGISMAGNSTIVFLDEPTTGLDPTTRRQIWDIIAAAKQDKCIVLTTHSLEEADVLASRIGIVVKGNLRCVGSAFHLKQKFGDGYRLSLNFEEDDREQVKAFVQSLVPAASESLSFVGNSVFTLPRNVKVSWLIAELEKDKTQQRIKDYAFSQTTLEDVFLNIVAETEEQPL